MQRQEQLASQLQNAVNTLNIADVESLLAKGALPSCMIKGTTALHLAVQIQSTKERQNKALEILGLLLKNGGDVSRQVQDKTVMNLAAHNLNWQAVKKIAAIKSPGIDSGQYGSALIDVVRYCEDESLAQELVHQLIEAGAIDNRHSHSNGYTSLHWAVDKNRSFIIKLLLAAFPENYLRTGGAEASCARMAFEQKSWECFKAIAEIAYLPVINGEQDSIHPQLVAEKKILFHYVCHFLTPDKKWQAILNGQDKRHLLGLLNYTKRDSMQLCETTKTVLLYKEEEKKMRAQGFPDVLQPKQLPSRSMAVSSPIPIAGRRISAPMSSSGTPKIRHNYLDEQDNTGSHNDAEQAYSPLFRFGTHVGAQERLAAPRQHQQPHSISPQDYIARLFQPAPPHESDKDEQKFISRFG